MNQEKKVVLASQIFDGTGTKPLEESAILIEDSTIVKVAKKSEILQIVDVFMQIRTLYAQQFNAKPMPGKFERRVNK